MLKWLKRLRISFSLELRESYTLVDIDSLPSLGSRERRDQLRAHLDSARFLYKQALEAYDENR